MGVIAQATAPLRSELPVFVLTGPTGVGKSDWAIRLAGEAAVEIVSVDSALVYRGLDIGSAKPPRALRERIRPAERAEHLDDERRAIVCLLVGHLAHRGDHGILAALRLYAGERSHQLGEGPAGLVRQLIFGQGGEVAGG